MVETYFAIKLYILYVMLAVMGACGIIMLVLLLKERIKRR